MSWGGSGRLVTGLKILGFSVAYQEGNLKKGAIILIG
jgi:hypothetical protein